MTFQQHNGSAVGAAASSVNNDSVYNGVEVMVPTEKFIKVLLRAENGAIYTRDAKRYDLSGDDVHSFLPTAIGVGHYHKMSLIVNREAQLQRYDNGCIILVGEVNFQIYHFPPVDE